MSRKKRKAPPPEEPGSSGTSLGGLLGSLGLTASATPAEAPAPAASGPRDAAKVVVRKERKGRGGKTVTVIAGLGDPKARAKALGKVLGTGARVEGDTVVVQGELVERVATWLEQQGVKRIVRG